MDPQLMSRREKEKGKRENRLMDRTKPRIQGVNLMSREGNSQTGHRMDNPGIGLAQRW